jgi:hypothetical protein
MPIKKIKRTPPLFIVVKPVGSKFAKAIQQAVKEKSSQRVLRVGSERVGRINFKVTPHVLNKIEQFNVFKRDGVSCPAFTTDSAEVANLGSKTVFARTLVNSTNGRGIVEFDVGQGEVPRAPLYTAYIPKKAEYRVHVFGGQVIDIQQKRKKRGHEGERDTRVRNVQNGYVYCREGIAPPEDLKELAINAVKACAYQYGAVDVIYNEKQNKCFVLEVNSRPGLMGTTTEKYADALIEMYKLEKK